MKKNLSVLFLGILFISMFAGFVSAQPGDGALLPLDSISSSRSNDGTAFTSVQNGVQSVYTTVEPVVTYIIGETGTSEFFLAKILFLIIIFAVVWKAMQRIPFFSSNEWVLWVVSIGVSILAIRWFGNVEIVKTVILPYSVLGIVISAGIPLILAFLIIEGLRPTMRKTGWIFFAVVFVFLWASRMDQLGQFGNIYLVAAGLALLMLFMDSTIQKWMGKMKLDRLTSAHSNSLVGDLKDEMKKLTNRYHTDGTAYTSIVDSSLTGKKGWKKDMDDIKTRIDALTP